ncbi:MAG: hypothetical protein J3K34DRAFT_386118, partial [Monoraphidium minutum]
MFDENNRLALPGCLHRISAARGRGGAVIGLTYRVGRHAPGAAAPLRDVLALVAAAHRGAAPGAPSLLLLGRPGVGKTTLLRDVARYFSEDAGLAVVVVDGSNEIAGDGDEPHPCIGRALRLQVPRHREQWEVMMEAVANHGPDVVVVDEITTPSEAHAARQIAARGVVLVATAHGTALPDVLRNPDLARLAGGVTAVTLGDEAARRGRGGAKTRLERAGAPVFPVLVEMAGRGACRLHLSVAGSVDCLLAG